MADLSEVAIGINAAGDLIASVSIATGTSWDNALEVGFILSKPVLTADRRVRLDIVLNAEAISAGILHGHIDYLWPEPYTAVEI